jgi:peroxiredoxin
MALHSKDFAALGASVLAVVTQRSEKVKRYVEDQGLPFEILIDDSRDVVKAYGVWHRFGFDAWNIAKPSVFLIDRAGVVRYVFVADFQTEFPDLSTLVRELEVVSRQKTEDRRQNSEEGQKDSC